jgi:hypothetical protein
MSWRSTTSKLALALLALLHPGCGGGGGATLPESPDGLYILKITYFRPLPEQKTRRPNPTFRAIMSESWRDRVANGPREPLAKAASPKEIYLAYLSDRELYGFVKKLKEMGVDDLKASKPEDYDPDLFRRKALDPTESSFTRVFTIGDDKGSKSYYYKDQQTAKELIEKFVKCEAFVARACENSISTNVTTDPLPAKR